MPMTEKRLALSYYWALSSAYRGRVTSVAISTVSDVIHGSRSLAGDMNCVWGRLENHAADLLNTAIKGGKRKQTSTTHNVVPLHQVKHVAQVGSTQTTTTAIAQ